MDIAGDRKPGGDMVSGSDNVPRDPVFEATNNAFAALKKLKDPADIAQALRFLSDRLGVKHEASGGSREGGSGGDGGKGGGGKPQDGSAPTPKEFMVAKKPMKFVERVACLAYYLTHHRDMPEFKTVDLTALNTEAKQPRWTSATVHVENATKSDLLTAAGRGMKALGVRGEALVEALPDREKVKVALEENAKASRRRRRKKAAK
jgi:hypothetical protein